MIILKKKLNSLGRERFDFNQDLAKQFLEVLRLIFQFPEHRKSATELLRKPFFKDAMADINNQFSIPKATPKTERITATRISTRARREVQNNITLGSSLSSCDQSQQSNTQNFENMMTDGCPGGPQNGHFA